MTPAERDDMHRRAKRNPSPKAYLGFAVEMARFDNAHIDPVREYMSEGMTKAQALAQLKEDLEDSRDDWRRQWADDLADEGARTNAQLDEAHDEYVRSYLSFADAQRNPASVMTGPGWNSAREKLRSAASKKNPDDSPDEDEREQAATLYERFHRYPPIEIGDFDRDFMIPVRMLRLGPALWTTYRSAKVDPATLKKPKKPVNYIHEHDAGVEAYVTIEEGAENGWSGTDSPYDDVTDAVDVPLEFQRAKALVKLGESLGYKFRIGDDEIEAEAEDPLPELYATPDGKCLLVIQDKRDVLAMIWGGALGVFPRGIDG